MKSVDLAFQRRHDGTGLSPESGRIRKGQDVGDWRIMMREVATRSIVPAWDVSKAYRQ